MSESLEGLQTVIFLDQHDRWRRGDRPWVESYLRQIPDLGADTERLLDVIYHEILLRESLGERPDLADYQRRFPELAAALAAQFEVHSGIPSPASIEEQQFVGNSPPEIVGYRIVRELGRGTFGVVYQAWELALKRPVALKVVAAAGESGDRLFREAQAIAQLTHPNIVPIHAVGETSDGVFFSQDLLADGTLAELCRGKPQPVRDSAAFMVTLADAVHYAHLRQLVHCDLKPSNILLRADTSRSVGKSASRLADFAPLISDFGLAVHLEAEDRAFQGHVRGTLQYMAPEQTGQAGMALGPATDIYALGVILHELLTGQPPFSSDSKLTTFLQIRHASPTEPKSLRPDLPGDLNAICLACLAKDPANRYSSAAVFADDLRRFLDGYSPTVVTAGTWGHVTRWCRRRPVVALLLAAMVLLAAGSIALTIQHDRQQRLAAGSEQQRQAAKYRNQILSAANALEAADIEKARELLEETDPRQRSFEWYELKHRCTGTQTRIPWDGHDTSQLAVSPDGRLLAVGDAVDRITLLDARTGKPLQTLSGHGVRLTRPVFHPQGTSLAAAGIDRGENEVWIWDIATGKVRHKIGPLGGTPLDLVFVNSGEQIVTASCHDRVADRPLVIETWQPQSGNRLRQIQGPPTGQLLTPNARLSPEGKWLAWTPSAPLPEGSGHRHQVELVDADSGSVAFTLDGHAERITAMAFSPNAQWLATFDDRQGGFLWNPASGKRVHPLTGLADAALSASFSPDGKSLATAGRDQLITLWNCESGERLQQLRGHESLIWAVCFGTASNQLYSSDKNRRIYQWKTSASTDQAIDVSPALTRLAFNRDGSALMLADLGARFHIRNLVTGEHSRQADWALDFAVDPESDVVAAVDGEGQLRMGSRAEPRNWFLLDTVPKLNVNGSSPLIMAPGGKVVLALGATGKEVLVIDVLRKKQIDTLASPGPTWLSLACSSDGRTLAIAGDDQTIQLWNLGKRRPERTIRAGIAVRSVAFRPGGEELATLGAQERFVQIWDTRSAKPLRRITGHKLQVTRLLFTPDGKRMITGSADRTVKVWDCDSGELLLTLDEFPDEIRGLAISADSRRLLVGSGANPERSRLQILGGPPAP